MGWERGERSSCSEDKECFLEGSPPRGRGGSAGTSGKLPATERHTLQHEKLSKHFPIFC